mgnify:CR=1 FL=1
MIFKKFLLFFYKKISFIYIFIFGRKRMQFFNNIFLSLTLNAKGYKNYGSFEKTGEKKFINKISKDLSLCLDIGANIGAYTKLLLSETNAKIISFEPLPNAFEDLKKIEDKNLDRLKVFNYAIGEKNDILDLNYSDDKSEKASFTKDLDKLSFYEFKKNKKIKSEVVTLDYFFNKNLDLLSKEIDLIKIDTEGFEFEVIIGAKQTIKTKQPKYIQIEFNWHQLFKGQTLYNFSRHLEEYDLFQILPYGNDLVKVDPNRPETNIFHLSNFIYIRKDISRNY